MAKRLFIGIGVEAPAGMEELPGVHEAIARIAQYADGNDAYDPPILFLDKKDPLGTREPVTAEAIRAKLTPDLLIGRPRITVYFCGHGAFLNGREIWYLSAGKAQWSQRVDVSGFRDMLQSYGPGQIGLFSDACQTAEYGDGGASPVLDYYQGAAGIPKIDIFRATIRGKPAYATQTDGPLFSSVIAKALTGTPPDSALDKQYLLNDERVVSSQSLATYVEEHLPDYAALGAGQAQIPEIVSGFRYDTNDYLKLPPLEEEPEERPRPRLSIDRDEVEYETKGWDTSRRSDEFDGDSEKFERAPKEEETRPDEAAPAPRPKEKPQHKLERALDASLSEWRQDFWYHADRLVEQRVERPNLLISVAGADIDAAAQSLALVLPEDRTWRMDIDASGGWPAIVVTIENYREAFEGNQPFAPLLSVAGLHIPLELQRDPDTVVLNLNLGETGPDGMPAPPGVGALGWNNRDSHYQLGKAYRPMEVLKGLMTGVLTADLVQPMAARMRYLKHADPLYGIAAAYLYDRIGDLNSIRRMCLYYARYKPETGTPPQGIPFDIAMLSRLPFDWESGKPGFRVDIPEIPEDDEADREELPTFAWQAMEGEQAATVAGLAPVLQAGWTRLATLRPHALFQEYLWLQEHMTNAPFASFQGDAAHEGLLNLFSTADARYEQGVPI
ncbi:hypothetical protein [Roseibium aggregatum]|uniref:Caspase domain-containing protein n=1 Tax=Roseibium aggregatum TaxID=187304 RepID=A0A926SAN6_9HYPH|nr:hypothetical protein [Roseibium aggregatum]MBD1549579.1 hypothetical protein [Roseibium aggregatum]